MNWLRKHKNTILGIVVGGFIISMFVGFGAYMRFSSSVSEPAIEVNDEKIPYKQYLSIYNRVINARRDKGETITPEIQNQTKNEVVQSLIQESVFFQESRRYGIEVTDQELAQNLYSIPAFQKDGKFNVQSYAQTLQYGLKTTPEEFEDSQRRQIAIARLRALVMQSIKITDRELDLEYSREQIINKGKKKDPKKDAFQEKEELRQKMLQEKGAHVLNRWYQQLGTGVKVKIHLDEIEKKLGATQ